MRNLLKPLTRWKILHGNLTEVIIRKKDCLSSGIIPTEAVSEGYLSAIRYSTRH